MLASDRKQVSDESIFRAWVNGVASNRRSAAVGGHLPLEPNV